MAKSRREYSLDDHVGSDEEKTWVSVLLMKLRTHDVVQSPIVISGPHGTGKSQLLKYLHESLESEGLKTFLVAAEEVIAAILESVRSKDTGALDALVGADVLLIDDFERFSRKTETQRVLVDSLHRSDGAPSVRRPVVIVAGTFDGLGDGSDVLDDWFYHGEWKLNSSGSGS